MKETYWGYWLVLLGVFIIGVMLLVNNITTTNTQDYYNVKEVTQASMVDAIDFSYYRLYGNLKISEQKFIENFVRRFSENLNLANTYDVDFYDLYEVPPKVSVKISTRSNAFNVGNSSNNSYDVVTTLSTILELGVNDEASSGGKKKKTGSCPIRYNSSLQEYLKSDNIDARVLALFDATTLEKLRSDISFEEFAKEFKKWFISKGYDKENNYKWPEALQALERQGYLTIIKNPS